MARQSKMTTKGPLWIAVFVAMIVLVVGFGIRTAAQLRYDNLSAAEKVAVICSDLRAPGDPSTVNESSLGLAFEIRQEVTTDVQNNMSKNQIFDAMVARYGDGVLAVPRFRGFGVMTWFAPFLVALMVLWGTFTFIRRSAATRSSAALSEGDDTVQQSGTDLPSVKARLKDYL